MTDQKMTYQKITDQKITDQKWPIEKNWLIQKTDWKTTIKITD